MQLFLGFDCGTQGLTAMVLGITDPPEATKVTYFTPNVKTVFVEYAFPG